MKNVKFLAVLLVLLMVLAGCGNKTAKISNDSEVIFKVGKTTFTKGDLYETLKQDDQAYSVVNNAGRIIADAEVETTAEMLAKANETVATYKETFGDDFEETIKSYGYADEADFLNSIVNSLKAEELSKLYFETNKSELYAKYSPVLAKMMYIEVGTATIDETSTKAQAAHEMITNGETFEAAAEKYATNPKTAVEKIVTMQDDMDLNVAEYIKSVTAPGLSSVILDKSNKGFYIVQVTGTSQNAVEEEFVKYLTTDADFTAEVDHYYFAKHEFKIYDVDVYNYVTNLFPNYLSEEK